MVFDAGRAADGRAAAGLGGDSIRGGCAHCCADRNRGDSDSHALVTIKGWDLQPWLGRSLFEFGLKHLTGVGECSFEWIEQRLGVLERASTTDRFDLLAQV